MSSKYAKYIPPAPTNVIELHPEPRQVNIVLALNVPERKRDTAELFLGAAAAVAAQALLQSAAWARLQAMGATWEGEGVDWD